MEGELNVLRKKLDEVKGKLEDYLITNKQQKHLIRELEGSLGWHINAVERYEKALETIQETYKNGGTAYRISKKALGK